jgi:hypothetical protein
VCDNIVAYLPLATQLAIRVEMKLTAGVVDSCLRCGSIGLLWLGTIEAICAAEHLLEKEWLKNVRLATPTTVYVGLS